jgi:hypothetical protein
MCELNGVCACCSQVHLYHAQVIWQSTKSMKFCGSCDINLFTIILGICYSCVVFFCFTIASQSISPSLHRLLLCERSDHKVRKHDSFTISYSCVVVFSVWQFQFWEFVVLFWLTVLILGQSSIVVHLWLSNCFLWWFNRKCVQLMWSNERVNCASPTVHCFHSGQEQPSPLLSFRPGTTEHRFLNNYLNYRWNLIKNWF